MRKNQRRDKNPGPEVKRIMEFLALFDGLSDEQRLQLLKESINE